MNSNIRQEVFDKLYNSKEYLELKTNKARVEYVLNNIMSYKQIKAIVKTNIQQARLKNAKNVHLAKGYKMEGDLFLQQVSLNSLNSQLDREREEFLNHALHSYMMAILNAPISDDMTMASKLYLRKCQAHLQLEQYEAALYSIEMAIEMALNDPNRSSSYVPSNLMVIKVNCLKSLGKYHDALNYLDQISKEYEFPEQKYPASRDNSLTRDDIKRLKEQMTNSLENSCVYHPQTPKDDERKKDEYWSYIIDERCNIVQSPVVGRHFIAKEDISEQTLILQEKPYSIIIENEYMKKKCSACYRDLNYKFFPCLHCTELVFCNMKCFEQAYRTFHRFECGIISVLRMMTSPSFHVFRMISRIGPVDAYQTERFMTNYSINEYMQEESQRTVPEIQKTKDEKLRAYKMSSQLWDHDSKHSSYSNVHHILFGIETAILLDLAHNMFLSEYDNELKMDFIDMIIVDIRRIIFNVFGWHEYNEDWTLRGHVANCQCLVGSLVNHSCVPNTNWEFQDGQIRFTTNKTIRKGEEITITYGPSKDLPYHRRQERLNNYFFACRCAICLQDAKKGKALKCDCNGPVPFDGPMDNEPVLAGQCLLCFQKIPDFKGHVEEYRKCKRNIREVNKVVSLRQDSILIQNAKDLAEKFCRLSISPNPNVDELLLQFTNIIKLCDTFLKQEDKFAILNLMDHYLPLEMACYDYDTLDNLYYWFNSLAEQIQWDKQNSSSERQCDSCNLMLNFRKRINSILATFEKNEKNQLVLSMISHLSDNLKVQYEKNALDSYDNGRIGYRA